MRKQMKDASNSIVDLRILDKANLNNNNFEALSLSN